MKVLKAKTFQAPFIEDQDGDWWVASRENWGRKKMTYRLVVSVEEFWEYLSSHAQGYGHTRKQISKNYKINFETWNVREAIQGIIESTES